MMAERPTLPLETQAAIERARERIRGVAHNAYPLVFRSDLARSLQSSSLPLSVRQPANLKLQLQQYSSALFDAEARHYAKHASSDYEMRLWLAKLSICILEEVGQDIVKHSDAHNFHCSAEDRVKAITDGLERRTEHWIKAAETDATAIMARARATSAHLERTMARAKEVLAELDAPTQDAPTQKEAGPTQPLPPTKVQKVESRIFLRRASWLKDRLREREWDHNRPAEFGGPDRKTMKRLLRGLPVHDGTIDKLISALNKHLKGKKVVSSDVPSN